MKTFSLHRRGAFTLIELVVVIAIIDGMLLPGLNRTIDVGIK